MSDQFCDGGLYKNSTKSKESVRPGLATGKMLQLIRSEPLALLPLELDLKKSWSGLCLASKVSVWPLKSLSTNQSSVFFASDEPVATRGKRGPGAWAVV